MTILGEGGGIFFDKTHYGTFTEQQKINFFKVTRAGLYHLVEEKNEGQNHKLSR